MPINEIPEIRIQKSNTLALAAIIAEQHIFTPFSSFTKLYRVVASILRFLKNTSTHRNSKLSDHLSVDGLEHSL